MGFINNSCISSGTKWKYKFDHKSKVRRSIYQSLLDRHRSDTFASGRCLIDIDPVVFAIWELIRSSLAITLQWRQNEREVVLNHRRLGCLVNRLFKSWSKKTGPVTWKMFPLMTSSCDIYSPAVFQAFSHEAQGRYYGGVEGPPHIFFRHHAISYGWHSNSSVGDSNYCYVIRRTY